VPPLTLIKMAWSALGRHRLRTALTVTGVAVGIAATLCTVALGEHSASAIPEDLIKLGDNLVWIQASVKRSGGVRAGGVAATLTAEDSIAIAQEVPEIERCTPQVGSPVQVIQGNQNWGTTYRGVSADYMAVGKWPVVTASCAKTQPTGTSLDSRRVRLKFVIKHRLAAEVAAAAACRRTRRRSPRAPTRSSLPS
jgi:putative ABC transport system permease protein